MKKYVQVIVSAATLMLAMQVQAQTSLGLKALIESKEFITADQAKDSCVKIAGMTGDTYRKLYCEPTVWISKVRYSWTEIRTKKEFAHTLVNTSESSSAYSGSSSSYSDLSVFGSLARWVSSYADSWANSRSSSDREETAVYNHIPVALEMFKDQEQVRYGYILYGIPQELNMDAPERYDSAVHNLKFSNYQDALSACNQNLVNLYGFQHIGKCSVYLDEQGSFGFLMEAKLKYK